jgi:hypothetical protein
VVMTCATTGRPEHGTARSDPDSSPLTVALGWNYYKNLRSRHFENATDLRQSLSSHRFWTNWNHFDLLFVGIRKSDPLSKEQADQIEESYRKIDAWLNDVSGARVHRYRAFAAKTLGDPWFRMMQSANATLSWLHNIR